MNCRIHRALAGAPCDGLPHPSRLGRRARAWRRACNRPRRRRCRLSREEGPVPSAVARGQPGRTWSVRGMGRSPRSGTVPAQASRPRGCRGLALSGGRGHGVRTGYLLMDRIRLFSESATSRSPDGLLATPLGEGEPGLRRREAVAQAVGAEAGPEARDRVDVAGGHRLPVERAGGGRDYPDHADLDGPRAC